MTRRCPSCRAESDPTMRFCADCGTSLLTAPPAHETETGTPATRLRSVVRVVGPIVAVVIVVAGTALLVRPVEDPTGSAPERDAPLEDPRWAGDVGGLADRPVPENLVAGRGVAVVSTEESLWAFGSRDGRYLWGRRDIGGRLAESTGNPDYLAVSTAAGPDTVIAARELSSGLPRWDASVGHAVLRVIVTPRVTLAFRQGLATALSATGGERLWSTDVGGIIVDADRDIALAIGSGEEETALLHGVDLATGERIWSFSLGKRAVDSAPDAAIFRGQVVAGGADGSLTVLDASDGTPVWRLDNARRGGLLSVLDGVIVTQDRQRAFVGYQLSNGAHLWTHDWLVPEPRIFPIEDRVVVTTGNYRVSGLGLIDGQTAWDDRFGPFHHVAVDSGTLILADGLGRLSGVDVRSGAVGWETFLPNENGIGVAAGDDAVVTASRTGAVIAHDAEGEVLWRLRMNAARPAVTDGIAVLRHLVHQRPGSGPGAGSTAVLTAVFVADGAVAWEGEALGESLDAPPPVAENGLVVDTAGRLVRAHEGATGTVVWEYELDAAIQVEATIGVDEVLVADEDGALVAIDLETGERRWRTDLGSRLTGPAVTSGPIAVVATRDGRVRGVDIATGEARWTYEVSTPVVHAPVIIGDVVAVTGRSVDGLDLASGVQIWSHELPAPPAGPPATATGVLYLATTDGVLRSIGSADGRGTGYLLLPEPIGLGPVAGSGQHYLVTVYGQLHAVGTRPPEHADLDAPPIDGRG